MAIDSLKSAGSTLKNIQVAIDVVANNIANVSTQGYKEKTANFESVISSMAGQTTLSGAVVDSIYTNFKQGALKSTGSALDLSLQGNGFFAIQNGAGDIRFTRSSAFSYDSEYNLVDAAGNYLMSVGASRITIPSDATAVSITPTGEVMVVRGQGTEAVSEVVDQIQLVNVPNPAGLEYAGQNLYRETVNSGAIEFGTALSPGTSFGATQVVSGSLELSNVDVSTALVNLIALQRSYQALSKVADADNQITETTIGLAV